ncbi:MAG: helix-turn-helix domain-containing protein [Ktedonobacteraceae bacterium]
MERNQRAKIPNEILRHEREKRGWSQSRVAELLGADTSMISRWECGDRKPDPLYQEKLCNLFGKDAVELKFVDPPPSLSIISTPSVQSYEDTSVLQTIAETNRESDTALLIPPFQLPKDIDVLDRLLSVVKRPSSIDQTAIAHLETMTRSHWQLYALFEDSVQYRYDMLSSLSGHLRTITRLMEHPYPSHLHGRLSALACETTQLMGEIFFDVKDSVTAERYYNTAIAVARETQNNPLLAITLGRKSFIPIYSNNAEKALPLFQEAYSKLTDSTSDIIRAWLSAREAEVYASIGKAHACTKALERAESYFERAYPGEATSFAFTEGAIEVHFTRMFLLGYKGACYTRLRQPEAAQEALQEDLATMNPARTIHKTITLVDLARTYIQQGEIEEACTYVHEALDIMIHLKSARVFQRILDFRHELENWKDTEHVKNLDQQITTLSHIIG